MNQNRKKIRDNTKSGCIMSSPLPFPCSSSNKCCPLVACLLLSYSHLTASWLTATEEWWTWEESSSPPAQHSNLIILSCLPCWQLQQPGFLGWVAAAQSFPITHNTCTCTHAHFIAIVQPSGSCKKIYIVTAAPKEMTLVKWEISYYSQKPPSN